jgi:1-acyl-sn-glycerol-3-phosphate acyltransferase
LKTVWPIAVDRSNNASIKQIIKEGRAKLELGISVVMFPEGTRIKVKNSVNHKPSAAKLALEAKVPVVLIAHNAGLFWPKGIWFKKNGEVQVKIIECLSSEDIQNIGDVRDVTLYIQEKINIEKNLLAEKSG